MENQEFYENQNFIGTENYYQTTQVNSLVATDGVHDMFSTGWPVSGSVIP